jgi:hypothetical protein
VISTEQRLWQVVKKQTDKLPAVTYTRIETGTIDGVSDIEYVAPPWCGWIELKTARMPRAGKPFSLQSDFTLLQCDWLLRHHVLSQRLRSWVLLGVVGQRTWKEFVLFPAPLTTYLLRARKGPAHEWLLARKGVVCCGAIREAIAAISSVL